MQSTTSAAMTSIQTALETKYGNTIKTKPPTICGTRCIFRP